MTLPPHSRFPLAADLPICRILNGMWQVSGAHGAIDPARAVAAMFAYHEAGFTTWDLADHYGPAEDFIGAFRRRVRGAIRRRPPRRDPGFHEMGPLPRADDTARRRGGSRDLACGAWTWIVSICCNSIGGITATGAISTRCGTSPICARKA